MNVESKGRDLFIVDNSVSGWTGVRYLEEWSGIAKSFDIATGFFEIGALLALDGTHRNPLPLQLDMRVDLGGSAQAAARA